jgi:hypothetical protein
MNPDSAVPADVMSEKQTFRSERSLSLRLIRLGGNGSLPLSGHRSPVVQDLRLYNGEVRSSQKDFETLQLGAFATPGLLLVQEPVGLTAESGMKSRRGW